uniref:Ig-like domain-containing protein n=1 Tax=Myripristis murdjan TaxID=586833 RepID=A0A667ZA94_9TELE
LGHPVTIECQIKSENRKRMWYKLTTRRRLQHLATVDTLFNLNKSSNKFNTSSHHYSIEYDITKTDLSISVATRNDIGTYYCGVLQLNYVKFGPGTFLMLKGIMMSVITVHLVSVVQQPESESVQPGDSVTLSCSVHTADCGGEDTSVFWLKSSESSGPEIISRGNKSQSCKNTESGSPETSCVYKLPKQNLSSDDAGTYYCVVASCGETLFGNGTNEMSITTVIVLALSNVVLGIATLVLVWERCKTRSRDPTGITNYALLSLPTGDEVNYTAVTIAPRSSSSRTAVVKHSRDAVLYSEVRQCQQD